MDVGLGCLDPSSKLIQSERKVLIMKKSIIALAALFAAAGAQANTISYNFSNPVSTTEITQTGTLGLFDWLCAN